MALNERIQLEREIAKATKSSDTYYGQFTTHPKDVRKYNNEHNNNRGSQDNYHRIVIIIHIDTKDSIGAAQDQQAISEDSTKENEARAVSVTKHETDLTDPVHQASPVSETDAPTGAIHTHVQIHLCAICHASDVVVHNTP